MATINDVTICNSALTKLGAETILSLDDDTPSGIACKLRYNLVLDYVTSMHAWRFARTRVILAPDLATPAFGYDNQFTLPSDYLSIFIASSDPNLDIRTAYLDRFAIEEGKLLTDESTVYLIYIRKLLSADMPAVSVPFSEAVALYLATDLVMPITQSDTSKQMLLQQFNLALKKAKTLDARNDGPRSLQANTFVDARIGIDS